MESNSEKLLSSQHRRRLLQIAREAATAYLTNQREVSIPDKDSIHGRFGGAFVTFYDGTRLRGCVGSFAPTTDIAATVRRVTISSLTDARFVSQPITADELPRLTIEISLLTDPRPTDDPTSLVLGRDGILIRRGDRSGCFLPKVATERGWSVSEFLSNCCMMKAGLDAEAWKREGTEVSLFQAEVFSDRDEGISTAD